MNQFREGDRHILRLDREIFGREESMGGRCNDASPRSNDKKGDAKIYNGNERGFFFLARI